MIELCYEDVPPFDPAKFPDGPKGLADAIKAQGLRPAIWLGLWVRLASRMIQDHPDWILRDESGEAVSFPKWHGGMGILDLSVPAVRDYLDHVGRTVFGQWGYEGVKLDFSSFGFNHKRVRYRYGERSAVELRHELEAIFRRHLPADGFFGWCLVAGTAQPFLSQADYFRNSVDINKGDWPAIRRIAYWTANTIMLLQERPCLVNVDSVGWSKEFDETRWDTFLNFCAVTGGALEVSGDLRRPDEARLKRLAKTLELSDPLRRVRCVDLAAGPMPHPPSIWLAQKPGGQSLLGVFNWSDAPATVRLDGHDLPSAAGAVRDAWTGRVLHRAGLPRRIRLAACESRLMLL
jgi:alpha-galactosidase